MRTDTLNRTRYRRPWLSRPHLSVFPPYLPVAGFIVAGVFVWWAAVTVLAVPWYVFPGPGPVFHSLGRQGFGFLPDTLETCLEVVTGFAVAAVIGLPLAALMSRYRTVLRGVYPILIYSQLLPLFVLAVIVTTTFQSSFVPQVVVTAVYSFFPLVVNTADGLRSTDDELVELLLSTGASQGQIFRRVRIPSSLPRVFSGAKLAMIFAVSSAAIAEWAGGESGLGYRMRIQADQFAMPDVIATVVVLTAVGVVLFGLVAASEYLLLPWNRNSQGDVGGLWRGGAS